MSHDIWKRLAAAARKAPTAPPTMPFGFDTAVVAVWKRRAVACEKPAWILSLHAALICSAVIMILALALNYPAFTDSEPLATRLADSVVRTSLLP